jgi:hypothetical protein
MFVAAREWVVVATLQFGAESVRHKKARGRVTGCGLSILKVRN